MPNQLAVLRTDLPPPTRQLLHDERPVGSLTGTRMHFTGFADAEEAMHAAWVAFRTVSRTSATLVGARPTPIDIEPLALEWRDGRETIVASGRIVAALVRPAPASHNDARWFGFEIALAPEIPEPMRREIMHTAHRALLKSGVRWGLVRPLRRLRLADEYVAPDSSRRRIARPPRRHDARFRPGYAAGRPDQSAPRADGSFSLDPATPQAASGR